jgi:hypothetical protein
MWLTKSELVELTGKKQKSSQVQVLRFMGIEHKVRPDGFVLVLRAHVEQSFGLRKDRKLIKEIEPNWNAI